MGLALPVGSVRLALAVDGRRTRSLLAGPSKRKTADEKAVARKAQRVAVLREVAAVGLVAPYAGTLAAPRRGQSRRAPLLWLTPGGSRLGADVSAQPQPDVVRPRLRRRCSASTRRLVLGGSVRTRPCSVGCAAPGVVLVQGPASGSARRPLLDARRPMSFARTTPYKYAAWKARPRWARTRPPTGPIPCVGRCIFLLSCVRFQKRSR